jgi:hypothetical protein
MGNTIINSSSLHPRVYSTGSSSFLVTRDGDPGCNNFYGCAGEVFLHSLAVNKPQIHVIVDSTDCYYPNTDSINIYYRIQYTGSFENSNNNIYFSKIGSKNILLNFGNFYSTGTQVLNFTQKVHSSQLNGSIYMEAFQATDTIRSNSYPISNSIQYAISDSITSTTSPNFCGGNQVGLILNVANVSGRKWQWYLNGNMLVNQNGYSYTATQVGSYTCSIVPQNGCSITTKPFVVQVVNNPTASISAIGLTSICSGDSVGLSSNTANGFIYQWRLNGNDISGATSSTFYAKIQGSYSVFIKNQYGCSASSNTIGITVNSLPVVSINTTTNSVCLGKSLTLTGLGANTYLWNPGNVTGSSVSVSPTTTTTYNLTGTDAKGCKATASKTITVKPNPTITAYANNDTICNGNSSILNAIGGSSYIWMPGSLSGSSINVKPTGTTTYTVTGTLNGCSANAMLTINVIQNPTIIIGTSSNPICQGDTVTISASGAISYNWMPGSFNGSVIKDTPFFTTTYTVTGSVGKCSSTASKAIQVNPLPNIKITPATDTICIGSSVTLVASGANTYNWLSIGQTSSNITVSPLNDTVYALIGSTSFGCKDTAYSSIYVLPTPNVMTTASDTVFCQNDAAAILIGLPFNGMWSGPGITGNTFSPNLSGAGTHVIVYSALASNGCIGSKSMVMSVFPEPSINITASSFTYCKNDPPGMLISLPSGGVWSGIGVIGNSFDPIIAGIGLHNVIYTYTNSNGCLNSDTLVMNVSICTGTYRDIKASTSFKMYPNPTANEFKVEGIVSGTIHVFNAMGELLKTVIGTNTVSLYGFAEGVYYIHVYDRKGNLYLPKKVVKIN